MNILDSVKGLINSKQSEASKDFWSNLQVPILTPDIAALERLKTTWLFNYIPGFLEYVPESDLVVKNCMVFTEDKQFMLWKKQLGNLSYPIPMNFRDSVRRESYIRRIKWLEPGRIRGQLCLIKNPGHHFIHLDKDMGNTVSFTRQRVRVMIPYHTDHRDIGMSPKVAYVRAFMYIGELDYWKEQILKSDESSIRLVAPISPFKNKTIGNYYYFSELEYKGDTVVDIDYGKSVALHNSGALRKNLMKLNEERNDWNPKPDVKRRRK